MDQKERAELIARYEAGAGAVVEAIDGISERELDAGSASGEWTPRQVIHHLADAEMRSAVRLRQLIAEDSPVIQGYDEKTYTIALHYDRPVDASLAAVVASRRTSAELLSRLSDTEWVRSGTHTESGPYSVEEWLRIYAQHPYDHAEQIRRARDSAV